jgi:transposase
MWTPEHRLAADRSGLRYPSDLTNAEWAIVEPMIPPARHGGPKRSVNVREVLNGIFYILWTGCQWKALPKRSAAKEYSARLSGAMELGWHVRAHPPRALCRGARARRT